MLRPLCAVLTAAAVLVPSLAAPSPLTAPVAGAHACCRRAAMRGCATTAITCCPVPTRGHESTTPPTSTTDVAAAARTLHASPASVTTEPALARTVVLDAHAHARANAPPGPLYLRHLTLLV